jgi:hypothetical protein
MSPQDRRGDPFLVAINLSLSSLATRPLIGWLIWRDYDILDLMFSFADLVD